MLSRSIDQTSDCKISQAATNSCFLKGRSTACDKGMAGYAAVCGLFSAPKIGQIQIKKYAGAVCSSLATLSAPGVRVDPAVPRKACSSDRQRLLSPCLPA